MITSYTIVLIHATALYETSYYFNEGEEWKREEKSMRKLKGVEVQKKEGGERTNIWERKSRYKGKKESERGQWKEGRREMKGNVLGTKGGRIREDKYLDERYVHRE